MTVPWQPGSEGERVSREPPAALSRRHTDSPPLPGRGPPETLLGRKKPHQRRGPSELRAGPHPIVREAEVALRAGGAPCESGEQQPPHGSSQQDSRRGRRHVPSAEGQRRRPPAPAQERPQRLPAARLSRRHSGWRSRGADPARAGRWSRRLAVAGNLKS